MSERSFRQYFGPSARHDRACVEMSFPLADGTYRLAPLDPVFASHGLKLGEFLPDEPLPLEEAVSHLAGAMLNSRATWWGSYGRDTGTAFVAVAYPMSRVAALALETALDMVQVGTPISSATAAKLHQLSALKKRRRKLMMPMFRVAELLGRDAAILLAGCRLHQVGQGAKGMHFYWLMNERDALTGMKLEQNKRITAEVLRRFGLPTTRSVLAENEQQAREALDEVGRPCVVKPVGMGRGKGVATGLESEAEVAAAAAHALELSGKPVLIENHVAGHDHRLMVAGGELLWAYRKVPASVVGDGKATIGELIERENRRRAAIRNGTDEYQYEIPLTKELRRFVARRHGMRLKEVPAKGTRIDLAGQANIACGGVLEDVTGAVHPDNRALALRAARLFRIRTMGIDFITPDISRSWKEGACAIIEVNRSPGIFGIGDVSLAQRTLLPNRRSGCIPMIAVIGGDAYRAELAEGIRGAAAAHGLTLVTADYLTRAVPRKSMAPMTKAREVETLLLDREADAGLILCDAQQVERWGLPLGRCDLVVVEDEARLPWLPDRVGTMLVGSVSPAKIEHAMGRLARLYRDPAEGGPLPVHEPIEDCAKDEFRLKVWRARAMPRAWFWERVGLEAPQTTGLTTHDDLLGAVRALGDRRLNEETGAKLPGEFTYDELLGSWARVTFEAAIGLPSKHRDAARAALLAATERVNEIAATKID